MEVNSAATIFIPSTPTLCQLELLAASDDGAIKRDVGGLSDRWIHAAASVFTKKKKKKICPVLRPQMTCLTSTFSCSGVSQTRQQQQQCQCVSVHLEECDRSLKLNSRFHTVREKNKTICSSNITNKSDANRWMLRGGGTSYRGYGAGGLR